MKPRKNLYFVGNAHLDPVWMWQWQEASCEAKATLRSALDRMKEYPDFVFVCSASRVFEWIEEFAPEMLQELQQRATEGRFRIVGGWYVQPDCNLPSGESFARQGLYAQRYFKEKFGITARTGYNVDSFGHNVMIPQILRKSGMDQYIFMRPGPHEKKLPANLFRWVSPDGSEVIASRLPRAYQTKYINMDDLEELETVLADMEDKADPQIPMLLFFYGVGNHGGGPTKRNIESVLALREKYPDSTVIFSDLHDYFEETRKYYPQLPIVTDDLQHHASGCYSAVSAVKTLVRRGECAMYAAETFCMMTNALIGRKAPDQKKLAEAWKQILFTQFHDSLGGCSMKPVHDETVLSMGQSLSTASQIENNALQSLSWQIDTMHKPFGYPIVLFNPHSFPVTQTVTVNKKVLHILDGEGREIPGQTVYSPTALCRLVYGDTIFRATVPAMGYVCYYDSVEAGTPAVQTELRCTQTVLENKYLRVTFDPATGHICSMYDLRQGKEILAGHGGIGAVIDESDHDTWSHGKNFFDKEIGQFALEKMELIEQGPVRATMKVTSRYGASVLKQYYSLTPDGEFLEIRVKLDWHETQKMLKLRYQTALRDPKVYYEIPFGVMERPCDGEEEPGQMWIAARDETGGVAVINDCKYSSSTRGGEISITAIRSPYYQDHGRGVLSEECEVTDQGATEFRLAIRPMTAQEKWADLVQQAKSFNLLCTQIMESRHGGKLPDTASVLSVSCKNVIVSAVKRSEDGTGIVLRAYETDGQRTAAVFSGSLLPVPLHACFTPYSVNTYYLRDGETQWREVLMTEFEME